MAIETTVYVCSDRDEYYEIHSSDSVERLDDNTPVCCRCNEPTIEITPENIGEYTDILGESIMEEHVHNTLTTLLDEFYDDYD